ncbi:MAG: glycosyltransferase [Proteobacteria bacterium]|nr:glycosyltransferase [Pseudomonadota bacterium]
MSLHIVKVVPYFYPAWAYGGIPRLAYGLARALQERDHTITVVTTDAGDRTSRLDAGEHDLGGITVHRLRNLSNRLAYDHQLFLPAGARGLLDRVIASADVVHLHGFWHLLNNAAVTAAERHGVPVVMTPNGTLLPLERKQKLKEVWHAVLGRPVLNATRRFIAVSRAELNQFARAGVDSDRTHLVYNGLDLGEFEALPERGAFRAARGLGERPIVLYLGKLTPRKGVDHLLGAAARLPAEVVLVVAGNDMGVQDALEAQARDLELGDRVMFTGLLTGPERLAALADADLLVYPSTDEIFGLVPFEGLLCGTPAVVSDDCGCGQLVAQARAGELVRYGDQAALARKIAGLLDDEGRRRRMVARGRAFVERHFAWPTIAAQTEAVYRAALREGS